jgi:hypothetical protein
MRVDPLFKDNGKRVNNHSVIYDDQNRFLQSYNTIVVKESIGEKTALDPKWTYSLTTKRYVSLFLKKSPDEIRKAIKSGEYKITDLNR